MADDEGWTEVIHKKHARRQQAMAAAARREYEEWPMRRFIMLFSWSSRTKEYTHLFFIDNLLPCNTPIEKLPVRGLQHAEFLGEYAPSHDAGVVYAMYRLCDVVTADAPDKWRTWRTKPEFSPSLTPFFTSDDWRSHRDANIPLPLRSWRGS